jgi:hypothetical protein
MSTLKKLIDKEYRDNERSEESDGVKEANVKNEIKKPPVRRTVRGRTAAALAASSDSSSDSSSEDLYKKKINHTMKDLQNIQTTLNTVDSNFNSVN